MNRGKPFPKWRDRWLKPVWLAGIAGLWLALTAGAMIPLPWPMLLLFSLGLAAAMLGYLCYLRRENRQWRNDLSRRLARHLAMAIQEEGYLQGWRTQADFAAALAFHLAGMPGKEMGRFGAMAAADLKREFQLPESYFYTPDA